MMYPPIMMMEREAIVSTQQIRAFRNLAAAALARLNASTKIAEPMAMKLEVSREVQGAETLLTLDLGSI